MKQLGATVGHGFHISRLKNRLLFPVLQAHSKGKDMFLTFQDEIGDALKKACDHDSYDIHLVRAAQGVHKMKEKRRS